MARFRLYTTTGIFGHRYKGYYIIRNDSHNNNNKKKNYYVVSSKNEKISGIEHSSYWDAEWEIDKITSSAELLDMLKSLYNEDISKLNQFFSELILKDDEHSLTLEEKTLLEWITKIRQRRLENKPF